MTQCLNESLLHVEHRRNGFELKSNSVSPWYWLLLQYLQMQSMLTSKEWLNIFTIGTPVLMCENRVGSSGCLYDVPSSMFVTDRVPPCLSLLPDTPEYADLAEPGLGDCGRLLARFPQADGTTEVGSFIPAISSFSAIFHSGLWEVKFLKSLSTDRLVSRYPAKIISISKVSCCGADAGPLWNSVLSFASFFCARDCLATWSFNWCSISPFKSTRTKSIYNLTAQFSQHNNSNNESYCNSTHPDTTGIPISCTHTCASCYTSELNIKMNCIMLLYAIQNVTNIYLFAFKFF